MGPRTPKGVLGDLVCERWRVAEVGANALIAVCAAPLKGARWNGSAAGSC
jgi:hypothetical protein